jgi:hypothetical protein
LFLFVLKLSISSGLNEKYATSEADIRADPARRIINMAIPVKVCRSGGVIEIPERIGNKESDLTASKSDII